MSLTSAATAERAAPKRTSFRSELQGLRALAVGLVLLFHLWPHHVSGGFVGVDVFFVVSGFLITGHLYRELASTGSIVLGKFWARRVMRLLPLAFTVLLFTLVVMILFVPETVWDMNVRQILGSLFYVENWVLAADSVDYMAADNEPSLVQHYWSLSIEEQFYVLLPLILVGTYLLFKAVRKNTFTAETYAHRTIIWALSAIILLSFIFSVVFTSYNAAQAYFVTPTRFWEFALGGLMAMLPAANKLPMRLQNILGWGGIVFIVIAGLVYTGSTPFPGYTALLPVVGTALFIRYGSYQRVTGVYWWASLRPSIRMGDWSYAIYLWHWPLIIVASYQLEPFTWPHKIAVIVLTFVLSAASQRFIEDPLRHARPFKVPTRAFALMASNMAVIAAITFFMPQLLSPDTNEEVAVSECIGADTLLAGCDDPGTNGEPLISATQVQKEEEEPTYTECNIPDGYTDFDRTGCSLGASEESAELTIAVIGDSHARAWLPMFDELGQENNWNIQGYTKSGCTPVPLSTAPPETDQAGQETSEACEEFVLNSSEEFQNDDTIDVVVTAASPTDRDFYDDNGESSDALAMDALNEMWQQWEDAGKDVVVMGEVPHFGDLDGPTCAVSHPDDIQEECSLPTDEVLNSKDTVMKSAAQESAGAAALYDPVPGICDEERCYSMVGNLITRYDHHHLSSDFAKSFGPDFARFLKDNEVLES